MPSHRSETKDVLGDKYEIVPYTKTKTSQYTNGIEEETRYHVIDKETGEVVDDCDGHGYYTPDTAYSGFSFKSSDKYAQILKSKNIERVNMLTDKFPDFALEMDKAFLGDSPPWDSPKDVSVEQVEELMKKHRAWSKLNAKQVLLAWKYVSGALMGVEVQPDGTVTISEDKKEKNTEVKEKLAVSCDLYIDKKKDETDEEAIKRLTDLLDNRIFRYETFHVSYKVNDVTEKKFWRIIDTGGGKRGKRK